MSKENLDWQSFDSSDIPGRIPSADSAWSDMRRRLDDEMPGVGIVKPFYSRPVTSFKWLITGAVAVLLLLVFTLFFSKPPGFMSEKNISEKIKPGIEENASVSESSKKGDNESGKSNLQETNNADEHKEENNGDKEDIDLNAVKSKNGGEIAEEDQLFLKSNSGEKVLLNKKDIKRNTGNLVKYSKRKKDIDRGANNKIKLGEENKSNSADIISSDIPNNSLKDNAADTSSLVTTKDNVAAKNLTKNPSDSIENIPTPEPEPGESDNIIVRAGIQWNLQVPSPGSPNYFSGPTGKTEPYRILIPGFWANVQLETTILSLEINPFYSQHMPGKSFSSSSKITTQGDTIVVATELATVNRVFGTGINFGYSSNVYSNWWAGGGIEGNWWRNAVVTSDITEEKNISGSPVIVESNSFKNSRAITTDEWEKLSKFQVKINGEVFYRKQQLAAGLRIGFPIMPFSDSKGPQHPLDIRFIVQLPLLRHSVER